MKTKTRILLGALLVTGAAPATGQGRPVVIARIGDVLPSGDTIVDIDNARVANSGDTMLHLETDHPNPDKQRVLFRNGNVVARTGTAAPGGGTWESFKGIDLTDLGDALIHAQLENVPGYASVTEGLFYKGQPFLYEDDPTTAAGFGAGSYYSELKAVNINDNLQVLLRCDVHDTNLGVAVGVLMRVDIDATGTILNETVLIKEPQVPTGQSYGIVDFPATTVGGASLNNAGGGVWSARLDAGAAPNDDVCYFGYTTLIAQSNMPSVVPGRDWSDIGSPMVDSNATPSWVAKLRLDSSDSSNDRLILQDGNVYLREGSPLPAFAPALILDLGAGGNVWITDDDEVAYYAQWDDAAPISKGLFVGDDVMARTGFTTASTGEVVVDFPVFTESFVISDDGDRMMYHAILDNGDHAVLLGQRNIGEPYCSAEDNSSGTFAKTHAKGSTTVALNTFRLETVDLPTNQFAYYIVSMTQGNVLHPGGSDGRLCLGGDIGRFNTQVKNTGAGGSFAVWIDLTSIPVNPNVAVLPGDTWNFQAWARDGATSNFSLPLSVTFD